MAFTRAAVLAICLHCASAQSYYPEITLNGENPVKLGPVPEQFVDPGASCE